MTSNEQLVNVVKSIVRLGNYCYKIMHTNIRETTHAGRVVEMNGDNDR